MSLDTAVSDMHREILEERLQEQERAISEKMQVLEGWKSGADEALERHAIGYMVETYRLMLMNVESVRRFGPSRVQTNANEPGYWEKKGRELKAEGEGLSRPWHEEENFGDA